MWSFFSRDPSKDFPYDIGEPVSGLEERSFWKLHKGRKKGGGQEVSVFVFDVKDGSEAQLELAKAAVKRLKTLRHPSIVTYLDSIETEKVVYLATEPVTPLERWLEHTSVTQQQRALTVSWGLLQITKALSFLVNDGKLQHNNVCMAAVFVDAAGEWKLSGLEYVTSDAAAPAPRKAFPQLDVYDPPERADSGRRRPTHPWAADVWGLGCLVWEVFNGRLVQSGALKTTSKLPKSLVSQYSEMTNANPAARPNPSDVVDRGRRAGGFFNNNLIQSLLFVEEIQIKDQAEKNRFFGQLSPMLDQFPPDLAKNKILPQLITAFEFGGSGSTILAPMFKLGALLSEEEYQRRMVPCLVKLFSSPDRATRVKLLQQLETFVDHLQPSTVNDQIFSHLCTGFLDTSAALREHTVRASLLLAPKLSYHNLNVELLKYFARLQAKDEQGGIRTNTTVCIGKVAQYLHPTVRQKVLISAFLRATKDPFPPARISGVLGLAATQQYYTLSDVAARVLPALCQLCLDPELQVRQHCFKTLRGFLGKLEKVSEDPTLRESMEEEVNSHTPTAGTAAAGWAGWAMGALSSVYRTTTQRAKAAKPGAGETAGGSSGAAESTRAPQSGGDKAENAAEPAQSGSPSGGDAASPPDVVSSDGWEDDEDWGSLEDAAPPLQPAPPSALSAPAPSAAVDGGGGGGWDSWEDDDLSSLPLSAAPVLSPTPAASGARPASEISWGSAPEEDPFSAVAGGARTNGRKAAAPAAASDIGGGGGGGWDDQDWGGLDTGAPTVSVAAEERRGAQAERRAQRQKELEAKRAARRAGPMKLGAKKL